jgi:hypothetical protein
VILVRHGIQVTVGKLREHFYRDGFDDYLRKVIKRLELPEYLISEARIAEECTRDQILAAVCMRGMCAAVLETVILLERWIYVTENVTAEYLGLHRIFNPIISPRGRGTG